MQPALKRCKLTDDACKEHLVTDTTMKIKGELDKILYFDDNATVNNSDYNSDGDIDWVRGHRGRIVDIDDNVTVNNSDYESDCSSGSSCCTSGSDTDDTDSDTDYYRFDSIAHVYKWYEMQPDTTRFARIAHVAKDYETQLHAIPVVTAETSTLFCYLSMITAILYSLMFTLCCSDTARADDIMDAVPDMCTTTVDTHVRQTLAHAATHADNLRKHNAYRRDITDRCSDVRATTAAMRAKRLNRKRTRASTDIAAPISRKRRLSPDANCKTNSDARKRRRHACWPSPGQRIPMIAA